MLSNKKAEEIHTALAEACHDHAIAIRTVRKWVARFEEGKESIKDDKRSGHPRTSTDDRNVEAIDTLGQLDHRITWEDVK